MVGECVYVWLAEMTENKRELRYFRFFYCRYCLCFSTDCLIVVGSSLVFVGCCCHESILNVCSCNKFIAMAESVGKRMFGEVFDVLIGLVSLRTACAFQQTEA